MKKKNVYFKDLFLLCKPVKIIEFSLILLIITIFLDEKEIFTYIYNFSVCILIILILLLGLFLIYKFHLLDLLSVNVVNYLDIGNVILFLTALLYLLNYWICSYPSDKYKLWMSVILILCNILVFLFRYYQIKSNCEKQEEYNSNIIDLKEAYEDNFPINGKNLYFIDESPVEYDLLGRTEIINNLYYNIKDCKTTHQYIIGLTGSWGSGKTTIINNVKRKIEESNDNDLIIIDSFDPWIYESRISMFRAMVDAIISKIGFKFSVVETKRIVDNLTNIIFGYVNIKNGSFEISENKEVQRIRNIINIYLKENNKRIVFIIDNIERANKDNILLILKSAFSILNFDRMIYVISFDKEHLKKILSESLDTDYEFLEKIIQNEIQVPPISQSQIYNINYRVIMNILSVYGVSEDDKRGLSLIIDEYSKNIKDLRDLKRNINSIVNFSSVSNGYLNKIDSFVIKYISLNDNEFFQKIYDNRVYFVSKDYSVYQDDYSFDIKHYNEDTDKFFENLFNGEHKKYIDLLSICFPNVKQFRDKYNNDIIPEYRSLHGKVYNRSEYYKISREKRIYDGKFFDLYFTNTVNEFLDIDILVNNFVNFVNGSKKKQDEINTEYLKLLNKYKNFIQRYTLETLECYLDNINKNKLEVLITIYDNTRYCDDTPLFMRRLSAKSRSYLLVANMIYKLDDNDFKKFLSYIENDYKNLFILRKIGFSLKNIDYEKEDDKYNLFNSTYENIKKNIIDQNVNIYTDENYGMNNIFCFWDDEQQLKKISAFINYNSIYKCLADMIKISFGNEYGYRIQKDFNKLITRKKIEKCLSKALPQNEKEKFILNVYETSKHSKTDFDEEYKTEDYFNFDLSK